MSVNSKMTAIADAIRAKTGKTAPLSLDQMATEIEGISGGTELFAAIGVTYPAGSTLTCTNGTKTLTAKTTSGQWVFAIPEAGTWTVTATDGTETASETVEITAEGQSVNVELSYDLYIFNNGVVSGYTFSEKHDQTGSTLSVDSVITAHCGAYSWQLVYSDQMLDLSEYSTMQVVIERTAGSAPITNVGINTTLAMDGTGFAASTSFSGISGKTTITVDISKVNSGYFGFQTGTDVNTTSTHEIYSIVFKR